MPTRRIFISHSTKGEQGRQLLNAVADRLEQAGYDVLLDRKNLIPGDDWYQTVSEWMMTCSGAVLLLNKDAEKSAYVRHEASVLSHRWRTEDKGAFKLFVALIDPTEDPGQRLTRSKLSQGDLGATRISQAHLWSAPIDIVQDTARLPAALYAQTTFGDPTFEFTAWDQMIGAVAECLTDIRTERLETAVEAAQMDELRLFFRTLGRTDLVQAIAAWIVKECAADLPKVKELLTYLQLSFGARREAFAKSIRAAESHWLGPDIEKCPIAGSLRDKGLGGAAAVNGRFIHIYTLECFLQRALGPYQTCGVIKCDARALDEDSVVETIKRYCEPGAYDDLKDEDIEVQLSQGRTVCLLRGYPAAAQDDALIAALRKRFPYILFVAWPGPDLPGADLTDAIKPIHPAVDLAQEAKRRAHWAEMARLFA